MDKNKFNKDNIILPLIATLFLYANPDLLLFQ